MMFRWLCAASSLLLVTFALPACGPSGEGGTNTAEGSPFGPSTNGSATTGGVESQFGDLMVEFTDLEFWRGIEYMCACDYEELTDFDTESECVDELVPSATERNEISQCIAESARELDDPPPAGTADALACLDQINDDHHACIDAAEQEHGDVCSSDFDEALGSCEQESFAASEGCLQQIDDEVDGWADEAAGKAEANGCLDMGMAPEPEPEPEPEPIED